MRGDDSGLALAMLERLVTAREVDTIRWSKFQTITHVAVYTRRL